MYLREVSANTAGRSATLRYRPQVPDCLTVGRCNDTGSTSPKALIPTTLSVQQSSRDTTRLERQIMMMMMMMMIMMMIIRMIIIMIIII